MGAETEVVVRLDLSLRINSIGAYLAGSSLVWVGYFGIASNSAHVELQVAVGPDFEAMMDL